MVPYKILKRIPLGNSGTLFEMDIYAPLIANKAYAGNFVLIRINETGERIPLTIADYDRKNGVITLVFQVVGKSTLLLSHQNEGDEILDVVGPLGNKIHVKKYEYPIIIIGGGVGIAPCYPQAKELKQAGNKIISIIGARTKDLVFWRERMTEVSEKLFICTNDGSEGIEGFVTQPLRDIISKDKISLVIAIGPMIMMKNVAELTSGIEGLPRVKTFVSLNTIMIDGTGMCGGCRFPAKNGEIHFACVEGPDVDGHIVDFDILLNREKRFAEFEKKSYDFYKKECKNLKIG
ncbi:MAG: sulfide/dihydroorotate dehydrogenase-like FAD/NAD-binding protein [Candidatus Lokiarchaeota archaeon]|nr:sulfide/dihydroorotate dehydrogenase-like FAD/NAD-binding protein [Candidatus Lokiarchaeota archaeon]